MKKGQSLIELLIILALLAIILPALFYGMITSREGKPQQQQRITGLSYLHEAEEAAINVRNRSWDAFAVNGTFHPSNSGNYWTLVTGSELVNGFTRQIVISDVYRDSNGAITTSGGTLDLSTKKVVTTVSWTLPRSTSIDSTIYITRHENIPYIETTKAQFDLGTRTNTYTTNTAGGEVILGAGGGGGDWCIPSYAVTTVDLSRQGIPTYISAITGPTGQPNRVFTGTGGNASGPTFVRTDALGNPPTSTYKGEYDNLKANGVYGDNGNYAYIATDTNSKEILILDLTQFTDPPTNTRYKDVGWFDAPGNTTGNSVFVLGNVGYMVAVDKFYTFSVSPIVGNATQPRLNTSTVPTLAGTGKKIKVVSISNRLYAFVATTSTTAQLQILDVTDPVNPSIIGQANMGNNQQGVDIDVNVTGTRAYVVTNYTAGQNDFFVINTSTLSGNHSPIGSYSTNGMSPKGVAIGTGNRVMIVGTGGTLQYQVVRIDTETAPTSCAGLAVTNGANAIATLLQSDGYAYSYIVTGDTGAELKIILGGAGGQYVSSGTYESATFTPGYVGAFNAFSATVSKPASTNIEMQVAVANPSSGTCTGATFAYVGPNGDPAQKFQVGSDGTHINAAIPLLTSGSYNNPGRCFRYKVFYSTSDSTSSPVLYDVTVSYSP